ncbi:hypothetical protein Gotri_028031, partial [Gossypium trilobum]|nr:hypothetical protein [Gossypium trilobum]
EADAILCIPVSQHIGEDKIVWLGHTGDYSVRSVWRILHNYIPSRANRFTRRVIASPSCPRCNRERNYGNGSHTCRSILITAWAIWFGRNKQVMEGKLDPRANWNPLNENLVKLNFDVAYKGNSRTSCSGFVIGNSNGQIMGSGFKQNRNISYAFSAEALSCLQGLTFANDMGFSRLIVESDACTIISRIERDREDRLKIGPYIKDIKVLSQAFRSIKFCFTPRTANKASHIMAQEGFKGEEDTYWVEEAPDAVMAAVEEDRRWIDPLDNLSFDVADLWLMLCSMESHIILVVCC